MSESPNGVYKDENILLSKRFWLARNDRLVSGETYRGVVGHFLQEMLPEACIFNHIVPFLFSIGNVHPLISDKQLSVNRAGICLGLVFAFTPYQNRSLIQKITSKS